MRIVRLMSAAVAALFISGAAHAQVWEEYVNRADFFAVNFPGEPTRTDIVYKTAKGTSLQGHVYTAQDSRGRYSITVVDYNSAADELATAIDEAAAAMRAKGKPTYDAVNMLDMHRSWRMTVETPAQRRILAEILVSGDFHSGRRQLEKRRRGQLRRRIPQSGRARENGARRRSHGRHGDQCRHRDQRPADHLGPARGTIDRSQDRQGDPAFRAADRKQDKPFSIRSAGHRLAGRHAGFVPGQSHVR